MNLSNVTQKTCSWEIRKVVIKPNIHLIGGRALTSVKIELIITTHRVRIVVESNRILQSNKMKF